MGELIVAGGNPPPVLEPTEGTLDNITRPVGGFVEGMFPLARRVVRDDGLTAAGPQPSAQRITVIGGIG